MSYSHLSMLDSILEETTKNKVIQYFSQLTGGALDNITVSKLSKATSMDVKLTRSVLRSCVDSGFLKEKYAVRCPSCGMIIKKIDSLTEVPTEIITCYACDEEVKISLEDVEVIYEVIDKDFFDGGQRLMVKDSVAPEDTLKSLLESANIHNFFYKPSADDYQKLSEMYDRITAPCTTTKRKGDTLENFVSELFSLCENFEVTTRMRTDTNQIDCFVRNKMYAPYGIFANIGGRFIIECKNEQKPPEGSYMSKLHSIISVSNGQDDGSFIKLGIIVSKEPGPKTFKTLAHSYYLAHKVVIVSICLDELKDLLNEKINLLDFLDSKYTEVVMSATKDLKELGLI